MRKFAHPSGSLRVHKKSQVFLASAPRVALHGGGSCMFRKCELTCLRGFGSFYYKRARG